MKRRTLIIICAALLLFAATRGILYLLRPHDGRERVTQATPTVHLMPSRPAPTAPTDQAPESDRAQRLALEIERALVARDPQQRETAFNFLLPELLETEPESVIAMVARQEPGEARDLLRDEVTRQWIIKDRDAAIEWMNSFADETERKASATTAVRTLAASSPAQAIEVADRFGVGREDGSLEHLVQIWATENLDEATRWIENQPENPRTAQLRARIEQVRDQKNSARQ